MMKNKMSINLYSNYYKNIHCKHFNLLAMGSSFGLKGHIFFNFNSSYYFHYITFSFKYFIITKGKGNIHPISSLLQCIYHLGFFCTQMAYNNFQDNYMIIINLSIIKQIY